MLKKLFERSPITKRICRASSAIAPVNMVETRSRAITYCTVLCDKNFLKSNEADAAKSQYESFLHDIVKKNRELFKAFDYRK